MKRFVPLASGSKGNSLFLGTENTKILIDAGLSARELKKRLAAIDVDLNEIDAVVVTHEHTDHIRGLATLCSSRNIPIFANSETASAIASILDADLRFKIFSNGEAFEYGDLAFCPFSIQHDAIDPVGFAIHCGNVKIGVCADLGFASSLVASHLMGCDYLYVEANHQPEMVHACSRPPIYKQRVLGRQGHLSNAQCARLIENVVHDGLKEIFLAHLSSECNAPQVALNVVGEALAALGVDIPLHIAFQDAISQPILVAP
ncbi:MAG: putative metallo-hydrolase YycJ [Chlamydiae bacterium]|nr:putative metallo-hydrolase YycJ [Chlamydiota bacterium]